MQAAALSAPMPGSATESGGRLPASPAAPGCAEAAARALDEPAEWEAFGRPLAAGDGRWESYLAIQGMYCPACSLAIEDALNEGIWRRGPIELVVADARALPRENYRKVIDGYRWLVEQGCVVVLGPMMEKAFRQSVTMSQGDFAIFVTRPISATILGMVFVIAPPAAPRGRRR